MTVDGTRISSQDDMLGRLRGATVMTAIDVERRGRIVRLELRERAEEAAAPSRHEREPIGGSRIDVPP
jgi:hypothetical protein